MARKSVPCTLPPPPPKVYDIAGASGDRNCVVLNNIHIDIMDYIYPADCTDEEFRKMWVEFEWENKVRDLWDGHCERLWWASDLTIKMFSLLPCQPHGSCWSGVPYM